MNVLLDTHSFVYWIENNSTALSSSGFALILDRSNTIFLSLASIWELQVKLQLSMLRLIDDLSIIVEEQQRVNGLQLLPITSQHIYNLSRLPLHHNDPFDRILISQAMTEGFLLLSNNPRFADYGVNVIW